MFIQVFEFDINEKHKAPKMTRDYKYNAYLGLLKFEESLVIDSLNSCFYFIDYS